MLVHLYYIYTTQLDGTQNRELAGDGNLAETLQEGQTTIQEVGAPRSLLLLSLIIRPDANGNAQACHFSILFYFYIFRQCEGNTAAVWPQVC